MSLGRLWLRPPISQLDIFTLADDLTSVVMIAAPRKLPNEFLLRLFNTVDQYSTVSSLETPLFYYAFDEAPIVSCSVLPYSPCLQLALVLRLASDV